MNFGNCSLKDILFFSILNHFRDITIEFRKKWYKISESDIFLSEFWNLELVIMT